MLPGLNSASRTGAERRCRNKPNYSKPRCKATASAASIWPNNLPSAWRCSGAGDRNTGCFGPSTICCWTVAAVGLAIQQSLYRLRAFVRQALDISHLPLPRTHRSGCGNSRLIPRRNFGGVPLGFAARAPLLGAARVIEEGIQGEANRGEQEIGLSETTTAALKSIARKNGLTSNTLMQGAWTLLLSRYSGEDDVVFGAIRACRSNMPGAGSMVGLFINAGLLQCGCRLALPGIPLVFNG